MEAHQVLQLIRQPLVDDRHLFLERLRSLHQNRKGPRRAAEDQEGPELLQGLALQAPLEADRGAVHQEPARGEHEEAELARLPHGRGGGGVHGADGGAGLLLPATIQNGGLVEEAAMLPRGRQLDISQQRDCAVPPPDLPEGADLEARKLAHPRLGRPLQVRIPIFPRRLSNTSGFQHAAPDAEHLPGVRAQPPLLAASAHGMQAVPGLRRAAEAAGEQTRLSGAVPGDLPHLPHAPGAPLHHHLARTARAHAARPRREEEPAERQAAAGGPLEADARRGVRDGEPQEEPGRGEDDRGRLRHPLGREPGFRQAGHADPAADGETEDSEEQAELQEREGEREAVLSVF